MRWGLCLSICLSVAVLPGPVLAQSAPAPASPEWNILASASAIRTKAANRDKSAPETTQSISKRPEPPPSTLVEGWNLSASETSATLLYAISGKAAPLGFTCRKGDGFVTFRSPPVTYAAGQRLKVLLKSKNGAIRIDSQVSKDGPRILSSETPVRTSSLVFVLTPKKDEAKLQVGSWSAEIPEGTSDIKLLRFQSLCDQPLASLEEE